MPDCFELDLLVIKTVAGAAVVDFIVAVLFIVSFVANLVGLFDLVLVDVVVVESDVDVDLQLLRSKYDLDEFKFDVVVRLDC